MEVRLIIARPREQRRARRQRESGAAYEQLIALAQRPLLMDDGDGVILSHWADLLRRVAPDAGT